MDNMLKKVLLLWVCLLVFSCSPMGDRIKIGLIGPFTGPYQSFGSDLKNGADIIVETFNQNGGILNTPIELVTKDTKSSTETFETIIEEFKEEDVRFIIGPVLSNMINPALKAAKDNNILLISPTVSSEKASNIDDYFLRVSSTFTIQGEMFARHALENNLTKAAVVYDTKNADYSQPVFEVFKSYMEENGGEVVYTYGIKKGESLDSVTISNEIISAGADSVLFISTAAEVANIFHHLKRKEVPIQLYGSHWTFATNLLEHGGKSIDNMLVVTYGRRSPPSELYNSLIENYTTRFNQQPKAYFYMIYDALLAVKTGIDSSSSLEIEKVKNAIINQKNFNGIIDDFAIDSFGDGIRRFSFFKIINGEAKHLSYFESKDYKKAQ